MPEPNRNTIALLVLILGLAIPPSIACAQSLWIPRDREGSVMFEALLPGVEFVQNEDSFTGAYFLDARYPVSSNISIVGEMAYARLKGEYLIYLGSPEVSSKTIGNPYLGVEVGGKESPFFGEFGIRAPLVDKNEFPAALTGEYSDVGRWDAFAPYVVPIHAAVNLRQRLPSGVFHRLRAGTVLLVATESKAETDLYGVYSFLIGYEGRILRFGGGATGQMLITDNRGNLGGRTINQLEVHADAGPWRVRPGIDVKLPLGGASSLVSAVLGLSLSVGL
jgi:hypothetical protein